MRGESEDDSGSVTLTHWGAYRPRVSGNRVVAMEPLPEDPDPSPIGQSLVDTLTDPVRIAQPMVRAGYLESGPASRAERGRQPFVAVAWPEALDLVAKEIERVRRDHGNDAIFGGSYGWASAGRFHHAQSQLHRFLNLCGGYSRSVNTHSYAAAEVLLPHVIGQPGRARPEPYAVVKRSRPTRSCSSPSAGMPQKNAQVSAGGVGQHSVRGQLGGLQDGRHRASSG